LHQKPHFDPTFWVGPLSAQKVNSIAILYLNLRYGLKTSFNFGTILTELILPGGYCEMAYSDRRFVLVNSEEKKKAAKRQRRNMYGSTR
jgi:hypothetical protein